MNEQKLTETHLTHGRKEEGSQKLIVTHLTRRQKHYIVCALYEGNRLLEVFAQPEEEETILGNIYVGRVKDLVKSLNAAFIEIAPGVCCYYPLEELRAPVFVKKINSPRLVQGDELYVQVERESIKTKPPKVTTNLNFTGKYLVLTTETHTLGISKKLNAAARTRLKSLLTDKKPPQFGVVVRTNGAHATEEELLSELAHLKDEAERLLQRAPYQTCFSCVKKQPAEFLKLLLELPFERLAEILTDDPALYQQMHSFLQENQPESLQKLSLYEDHLLSLAKCFSLEVRLEDALKERVWLKSGGYLIIQPTEALTVIDVNSGKSTGKKEVQAHYLKLNLEAAKEIAAQLRLRNLSGIIVVDFIDLKAESDRRQLMEELRRLTQSDPVPVQVVDMTKLNLVELTRKKKRKSLREIFL